MLSVCTRATLILLLAAIAANLTPGPARSQRGIEVVGTEFRVTTDHGGMLTSRDLVGAVLTVQYAGTMRRLRIDAVEPDPQDASGEVLLHTFSEQLADGSWANICSPGPDGRRQGFPLAGRALPDGRIVEAPGGIELICTGGAQGKCVRFGYKPWTQAPDGSPMRDAYNTCVKMVRADYCGQDEGTTRNGMPIDLYDTFGLQNAETGPELEFEAGWTTEGAVCVRHVRVKENVSLDTLLAACPRLKDRVGEACTETTARVLGARLFNRSKP